MTGSAIRYQRGPGSRTVAAVGAARLPGVPAPWRARMKLVECVPNFSEGRRPEVVERIRDAIAAIEGATVLDVSSDPSHNRSVITFVATVDKAADAAFAAVATAAQLIDLTTHQGEHPRVGA